MNKTLLHILFGPIILLFICGCQHTPEVELPSIPDMGVSPNLVNGDLEITLPPDWNTFKIGENIALSVHLKSDIQVESRADFDAETYVIQNEKWVEVETLKNQNGTETFLKNEDILLDPHNRNRVVVVHPLLEKQDEEIVLLITIKGTKTVGEDKGESVGSYIVVALRP